MVPDISLSKRLILVSVFGWDFFYNLIAVKFLPNILPFRFCCKFPCFDIKQQYKKEILIIFYFKCFHVLSLISSIPSARILAMTSETCPAAPACQERDLGSGSTLTAHPRSCSPLSLLLNCCPDLLLAYQLAVTPGVLVLLVPWRELISSTWELFFFPFFFFREPPQHQQAEGQCFSRRWLEKQTREAEAVNTWSLLHLLNTCFKQLSIVQRAAGGS